MTAWKHLNSFAFWALSLLLPLVLASEPSRSAAAVKPPAAVAAGKRAEHAEESLAWAWQAHEPAPKYRVQVERDIVYAVRGDKKLLLDAYLPETDRTVPAVFVVHGGAWRMGSKRQLGGHAWEFARRGLASFAINYRLAPEYKFPAQINDCKEAVRWVRLHASNYRVDPDRLGAYGYSAGGHLVALLAVTGHTNLFGEETGHAEVSTQLQCVVAGGAPCDFQYLRPRDRVLAFLFGGTRAEVPALYQLGSPIAHVSEHCPPILFFHGTGDRLVRLDDVCRMVAQLRALGVEAYLNVHVGAGHIGTVLNPTTPRMAAAFLAGHLLKSQRPERADGGSMN